MLIDTLLAANLPSVKLYPVPSAPATTMFEMMLATLSSPPRLPATVVPSLSFVGCDSRRV